MQLKNNKIIFNKKKVYEISYLTHTQLIPLLLSRPIFVIK